MGLVAKADLPAGAVALAVPNTVCLAVDYAAGGVELPAGYAWPRLDRALRSDPDLPWDFGLALALLDALAGDGGDWWAEYADALLPPPAALTLPSCLPAALVAHTAHRALIEGAAAQKARLAATFPTMSVPAVEGAPDEGPDAVPTHIQWGFGCVRSRAFSLGPDRFAFVPFLDAANHADADPARPAAAYRFVEGDGVGLAEGGDRVELVLLRAVAAGEEVTVSYTGPAGATNRRLMAQYGFVPAGGNLADRVEFDLGAARSACSGAGGAAAAFSLDSLQARLGDAVFADAASGRAPRLWAALKSLPLKEEGGQGGEGAAASPAAALAAATKAAAAAGGSGSDDATPLAVDPATADADAALATALLAQVDAMVAEAVEAGASPDPAADAAAAADAEAAVAAGTGDPRLAAVLRYRAERGALLAATAAVLRLLAGQKGGGGGGGGVAAA